MLNEQEKELIKNFYGLEIERMASERIRKFLADKSIGYVELGNERGFLDVETLDELPENVSVSMDAYKVNNLPSSIKIKHLEASVAPQPIIDSFNRHIWYSRYCLTDVRVASFDVAGRKTFGLYVEGYVGDDWDNSLSAWEIFEENGDFICSLMNEDGWSSQEGLITHENFGGPVLPPSYTPELLEQSLSPIWIPKYGGFWVLPLWNESDVTIIT